ncbi:hypothetical protein D3C84_1024150 [compost metagenome]
MAANVFAVVDGKRILFESQNALFQQLSKGEPPLKLIREQVAMNMLADEIHEDVHQFIAKLVRMTESA